MNDETTIASEEKNEVVFFPAGLFKRLLAAIIDLFIVSTFVLIVTFVIEVALIIFAKDEVILLDDYIYERRLKSIASISLIVFYTVYFTIMEASSYKATLGKMIFKISVVDYDCQRISYWRSFMRTISKYISVSCLYIGFLIGFFTEYHQMLHDLIAKTYVVSDEEYVDDIEEEVTQSAS